MTLWTLGSLALTLMIVVATPGPGVLATVGHALGSGFRSALVFIAGIVLGDLIYLAFSVFGLSFLAQSLGRIFIIVKWVGSAYLVFLGFRLWLKRTGDDARQAVQKRQRSPFLGGLSLTLANPKVILFYCGFLPTFLDITTLRGPALLPVAALVGGVVSLVLIGYAYLASRTRQWISGARTLGLMDRVAGSLLIGAGAAMALRASS